MSEEFPYAPPPHLAYLTQYADFGDEEVTVEKAGVCPNCGSDQIEYAGTEDDRNPHQGEIILCHNCSQWCYEDELDAQDPDADDDDDSLDEEPDEDEGWEERDNDTYGSEPSIPSDDEIKRSKVVDDPSFFFGRLGVNAPSVDSGGAMVIPFDQPAAVDKSLVGGKGANLASLVQADFPVPPGFSIPAGVFQSLLPDPGYLIELTNSQQYDEAQAYVMALQPDETAFYEAFDNLGYERVAVRSSAIAEDSSDASYAGRQSSYLNQSRDGGHAVGGDEDYGLTTAIKMCWASFFTDVAIKYRGEKGSLDDLRMAVVVQAMVPSTTSGVVFTEDSTGGRSGNGTMVIRANTVVVDAVEGLGENYVSGAASPDVYKFDKQQGKVVQMKIINGGLLHLQHVTDLATLGMQLEKHFEGPQDIEWGIAEDRVFLLQSRPMTS